MEALTTTAKFGATAQGVIKRIDELIRRRKLDANRKTVVVMATNQGTLDLVANFACSCRAGPPDVQRALASTLVFTGDSETSKQVELFGLASFHDSALGDLPEGAAKAYGDYAFVRMMCVCGVLSTCASVPSHRRRRGSSHTSSTRFRRTRYTTSSWRGGSARASPNSETRRRRRRRRRRPRRPRRRRRDAIAATPSTRRHRRARCEVDAASYRDHEHERDAQHPPRQRRARRAAAQRPHLRQVGLDRDLQTGTEHGR